jgi:FKBP-type peptidyl-prolyl cis-trans isomerase 2
VNYIGKLQNGKIFDSNVGQRPFKFRLGNISKHVFELFLHLKQEIHNQIAKTKIKETNHTL